MKHYKDGVYIGADDEDYVKADDLICLGRVIFDEPVACDADTEIGFTFHPDGTITAARIENGVKTDIPCRKEGDAT